MIDPRAEKLVPLSKAARLINPSRPTHVATVWRWATGGVAGARLESIRIGGVRHTSEEAIARFIAALNGERGEAPAPPDRKAERAMKRLADLGL